MELHSKLSCGSIAYCILEGARVEVLMVGRVTIEKVDSPGIPGNTLFDNYKPQSSYTETYQCVETGIGTGQVFTLGKNIFETAKDAISALREFKQSILQKEEELA
jgi:hypothetical protein